MNRISTKLIICLALGVLVLASRFFLISEDTAAWIVVECGYWIMLVGSLLFGLSLIKAFCGKRLTDIWSRHCLGIVAVFLATVFVQLHEPHRFKVLQDEYVMAGVARSMHYTRQAFIGTRAHQLQGTLAVMGHLIEKRPLFFHFLQASLHDLIGYRPSNVFILNAAATFGLLLLTYYMGQYFGGKSVGLLCVALWMMLPLLAQESTSGGYDILNVLMIALFWYCGKEYLEKGGTATQGAMILAAVHLAQVRSESILYLIAAGALILIRWRKASEFEFGWMAVFAPIFLFLPLMVNLVFSSTPAFSQTEAGQAFISIGYLAENAGRALLYLFDVNMVRTNNAVLSIVGSIAMVLVAVKFCVRWKSCMKDEQLLFAGAIAAIVWVNFVLILCQFWGQLDDPVASRFALPLFLFMIMSVAIALGDMLHGRSLPMWIWVVAAIPIAFSASVSSFAVSTTSTIWQSREMSWFLEQVNTPEHRGALLIAQPVAPIVYNFPAVGLDETGANKWKIKECLKQKLYPEILVLERWTRSLDDFHEEPYSKDRLYDFKKGANVGENCTALDDSFKRETIAELRLRPNVISRISRIVAVEGKDADPPESVRKLGPPFKTAKDYDWYVYSILP